MKVLYYTNIPAPYRVSFFNELNKYCDVTVLFNGDSQEKYRNQSWFQNNHYDFKVIHLKKIALFQFVKILNDELPDIIIIGTYANLNGAILSYLLKQKKIKFFINADGGIVPEKESRLSKFLKYHFISKADYYLSSGKVTNKYLEFYGAKKENIYIYPFTSLNQKDMLNGLTDYHTKKEMRKQKNLNYDRLFISVGSFIPRKGYDLLLEAIHQQKSRNCGYLIIGGGVEYENLVKKAKEYGLSNVIFEDFCEKDEIINYYKMSDVFVMPTREDIWGLVVLEAMACGLPVLSSDKANSACELLNNQYLYPVTDIKKLSSLLDYFADMSWGQLKKIGKENYEKMRYYTIEDMVERHLEIFEHVLNNQ